MSTSYGNVFFLGVARIAGQQGIVVASHSYNTKTDLGAVKQVLEQPNMQMAPGKHYSFTVGQLAWHLIAGDDDGVRRDDLINLILSEDPLITHNYYYYYCR